MLTKEQKVCVISQILFQSWSNEKISSMLDEIENSKCTPVNDIIRKFDDDCTLSEKGVFVVSGAIRALQEVNKEKFEFFGVL
jgi:hypothetical protein